MHLKNLDRKKFDQVHPLTYLKMFPQNKKFPFFISEGVSDSTTFCAEAQE